MLPAFGEPGPADWGDRPVAVVGGGGSLAGADLSALAGTGARVLAVSGRIFDLPFAEEGFCLDRLSLKGWWERLRDIAFPVVWAMKPSDRLPSPDAPACLRVIPRAEVNGATSGEGALRYAARRGARRIALLGFDYRRIGPEWHANQQHYTWASAQDDNHWTGWARRFDLLAPALSAAGAEVIDASPQGRLTAFPKLDFSGALAWISA